MHTKVIIFALILSVLVVQDAEGWRWVKKVWRTAKKIYHGAKRIYNRYGWVRTAIRTGLGLLGDVRELRKLDDEEFDQFVTKLGEDIAEDFDEDKAKNIVDGLTELRNLNEDQFRELESYAADENSPKSDEEDQLLAALRSKLSQSDESWA